MRLVRFLLRLRYRIKIIGEIPHTLQPTIVFCSLTSQLDPWLIASIFSRKAISCHPQQATTISWLHRMYRFLGWHPLPDLKNVKSSFFRRKFFRSFLLLQDQIVPECVYLLFPQGHLQQVPLAIEDEAWEQEVLEHLSISANVAYAEVHGMLGSLFSARSFGGRGAERLTVGKILWMLLRNGIFWMPKRDIQIEISEQKIAKRKEEVKFVPHYRGEKPPRLDETTNIEEKIFEKLAQLARKEKKQIESWQNLYQDLMLDSLDITELTVWARDVFDRYIPFEKLQTVQDFVDAITKEYQPSESKLFEEQKKDAWFHGTRKSPRAPKGETIIEAFLLACDEFQSQIAAVDPFEMVSYLRLKSAAIGLAEPLRSLPGKQVGIVLSSSIQFNVLFFALQLAGKIPVPINWTLGSKHVEDVVQMAGIRVILTHEVFFHHLNIRWPDWVEEKIQFIDEIIHLLLPHQKIESLQLARKPVQEIIHHFHLEKIRASSPAVLVFTSGSEGRPKGVMLSHDNILSNQRSLLQELQINENDVELGILPTFHVYGLSFANMMPILVGYRAVYMPNFLDFGLMAQWIELWKVTFVATTPTFLKKLLQVSQHEQLKSVRFYSIGAEKAPESLYEEIAALPHHPNLVEGYGVTECSPCLTLNLHALQKRGVGKPLPGVALKIVDPETHRDRFIGKTGLVCACGPNVFRGYWGQIPAPFIDRDDCRWYITGDLGHLDNDGFLILEGRLSRSIKIGGELIYLQELESIILSKLPQAHIAIVLKETNSRPELILFSTVNIALDTVNRWLTDAGLSNLLRLQAVRTLPELPRLATGKIDYSSLTSL